MAPRTKSEMEGMIARNYAIIADVAALPDGPKHILGENGRCRFCLQLTDRRYRKAAHSFPEAMGNKTVFSRDECPTCNKLFGSYEGELCASIGALLTLGGTPGKGNKVRQTGRSNAPVRIRTSQGERRRISFEMNLQDRPVGSVVAFNADRTMTFRIPAPSEPFRPRHAYKALIKLGLGIMPAEELKHFDELRRWIQGPNDDEDFPFLDVGFSVGSVGNAPRFVRGTLLRRTSRGLRAPYMIFIFCAGSACWQLDLMPDVMDDHLGPLNFGCLNIGWKAVIADDEGQGAISIDYGLPRHFDWSSAELSHTPIAWIDTHFDYRSSEGRMEVHFR